jgi:flagellar biosynthesis protein FlhB
MFEQVNKVFKNIFSNEETIVFSISNLLAIFSSHIHSSAQFLTPFMISIVVAYPAGWTCKKKFSLMTV